jgi:hypothetical protein
MIRASVSAASSPECRASRGTREVRMSCLEDIVGVARQGEVSGSAGAGVDNY